jgi:hypothetical protein
VPRVVAILVALATLTVTACGGAEELPETDGAQLALSRDRIEAAIQTERRLRTSDGAADRLLSRVRKIVATGALEPKQLDEFGLAALGELRLVVPSLVVTDRLEIPRELDRDALRAFLAEAKSDPAAAMKPAAQGEVERIGALLEDADAESDSEIPVADQTASEYLESLAKQLRPIWPDLADELTAIRSDLA